MKNSDTYILLNAIHKNGSIQKLLSKNYSYSEIADTIKKLISNNTIFFENDKIKLSESGTELLEELSTEYKNTNKNSWIRFEKESKIEKISTDFIFLPNQNKLDF